MRRPQMLSLTFGTDTETLGEYPRFAADRVMGWVNSPARHVGKSALLDKFCLHPATNLS